MSGYLLAPLMNRLKCSIPDDHIDPRRSAFFMTRSVSGSNREPGKTDINIPALATVHAVLRHSANSTQHGHP